MPKKIIPILVSMLFILTAISVNVYAGSEEDPEITDETADTLFRYVDIISAWFFENPEEPDYLYTLMKIRDLQQSWLGGLYQIEWTYNDVIYASFVEIGYKGSSIPEGWISGEYGRGSNDDLFNMPSCEGSIDKENGIISWKIPKMNIGDPKSGDFLMQPWSKSCFSGIYGIMSFIRYIPILAKDLAPTYSNEDGLSRFEYGRDYIIQY
jgi:hypothetical protein